MGDDSGRGGPQEQAVLLVAGLADVALSTVRTAAETFRGLLRRSDLPDLAAETERDLAARGRLLLDRCTALPPPHLETLARHAATRRAEAEAERPRPAAPPTAAEATTAAPPRPDGD
ncbi:polyprenyl synthetase [Streptomyces sp. NPDC030392]|uniref:polyprenyl synthetase n=1 Tax=unclassified Streptomyces TaxID=2593676 RepID=UPI0033F575B5